MASVRPRLCTHSLCPDWIAVEASGDLTTHIAACICNRIAMRYARYVIDALSPITLRGALALGQRRNVMGCGVMGRQASAGNPAPARKTPSLTRISLFRMER